ncbi:MAG: AAC(3) family N-acetyltransferase [Anaerolineales bacterium]|jgi:aminoglycoside 3-N-acetyltransferase
MSEANLVDNTPTPGTIDSIKTDLISLGVQPGMILLVHSSLSKMGWVNGGAVSVILALEQVLGPEGTLVMPTHNSGLSDPAKWMHPPVPKAWWETVRATMPPYDPSLTPTRKMGAIPECFRKQTGVLRSNHPQDSFAAYGVHADAITREHALNHGLGKGSPLSKIYQLGGWVLLLGVGHENNTSLHLAEYLADYPGKKNENNGAPITENGLRKWVQIEDINLDSDDFDQIGADFARDTGLQKSRKVAQADALLLPQKPLVDYAVDWMEKYRTD